MISVLKNNAVYDVGHDSVTVTAKITFMSFENGNCRKTKDYQHFFGDEPVTFEGKAVLKEGDESNTLEATRIAEAKLERQFYKYVKNYAENLLKLIPGIVNQYESIVKSADTNISNCTSHIGNICDRLSD